MSTTPIFVLGALFVGAAVAAVLSWRGVRPPSWLASILARIPLLSLPFAIAKHTDKGMLKIIYATYQIVCTISLNLSINFPFPFSAFLSLLSSLQLEWLSLDCATGRNSFFTRVFVVSFTPLLVAVATVLVCAFRLLHVSVTTRRQLKRADAQARAEAAAAAASRRDAITSQTCYLLLLGSYLVLPPCAQIQFQALSCETLDGRRRFLKVDSLIDCDSSEYQSFQSVVIVLVLIFQSIPLVWFVSLYRVRHRLNPTPKRRHRDRANAAYDAAGAQDVGEDDATGSPAWDDDDADYAGDMDSTVSDPLARRVWALATRKADKSIAYLSFLWDDFLPESWYFEVTEIYRRIIFSKLTPA